MYTHGLEKIYAFENINPKSVKSVAPKEPKETKPITVTEHALAEQLLLELGPSIQEALPSFRLQEPVASLGISPFALKVLHTNEIATVEQTCHFLINDSHMGLGQSHIEEIEKKVEEFVGKTPFRLQKKVDWLSLVRIACKNLFPKTRFCFLSQFQLEELSGASHIEQQEILRLSQTEIYKTLNKTEEQLLATQSEFIETSLKAISEAYCRPWLKYRHGFSTVDELMMHLNAISLEPKLFSKVFSFLKLFGEPLKLTYVQPAIWASDAAKKTEYLAVEACAKSYFYQPFSCYPVTVLTKLVTKALALEGKGFDEGFIQKVVTTSPSFVLQTATSTLHLSQTYC